MTEDKRAIGDLLDNLSRAFYMKDSAGVIAQLADDTVTFDLAPPLKLDPHMTHDRHRLDKWFATWEGPIVSEPRDRSIEVNDDLAYAYGLQRMTGIKVSGEKVELWCPRDRMLSPR